MYGENPMMPPSQPYPGGMLQPSAPPGMPGQPAGAAPKGGSSQDGPSDIIVKAAAKNKFLDFRNNLILADKKDFAMIHGIGGAQHASRSTIKCLITDYSVKPSVVVAANIGPEFPAYVLELCKRNVGLSGATAAGPNKRETLASQLTAVASLPPLGTDYVPQNLANQPCVAMTSTFLQDLESEASVSEVKALLDLAKQVPALPSDGSGNVFIPLPVAMIQSIITSFSAGSGSPKGGEDFQYRQERVNSYRKEANGLCPVNILTINRVGIRKTGEVSKLPWTVKIENFKAPAVERGSMTSYNSRGIVEKKEAFVSLSDYDMFRCMYRVERFIELWEMTYGIPLVRQGVAERDAAIQAARQSGAYGQPY